METEECIIVYNVQSTFCNIHYEEENPESTSHTYVEWELRCWWLWGNVS